LLPVALEQAREAGRVGDLAVDTLALPEIAEFYAGKHSTPGFGNCLPS
jgi:hypothetical protein